MLGIVDSSLFKNVWPKYGPLFFEAPFSEISYNVLTLHIFSVFLKYPPQHHGVDHNAQ